MAVDLQELLMSSQAETLAAMGKAFALDMARQGKIADKHFDEVDLLQAAAAKELGKMGAHTDPRLPVALPGS
jgi:hypothetical protein